MKYLKFTLVSTLFSLALLAASCGGNEPVSTDGPEYTSNYICPMHCKDSGSDLAGTCPACKMDYVLNKDAVIPAADPHDHSGHGHSHDGHDHSGHNH